MPNQEGRQLDTVGLGWRLWLNLNEMQGEPALDGGGVEPAA